MTTPNHSIFSVLDLMYSDINSAQLYIMKGGASTTGSITVKEG